MTSIFIGGALGSILASVVYAHGGWIYVAAIGSALPLLALILFMRISALSSSNSQKQVHV
ncbi:hypothetical protein [Shewanella sp. SG44-6]|nr:hypothetical protein [Shewanella sp. SG44-6]